MADPVCARLMAAGCGKGAASFLSLVPMAKAFLLKDAVFVTAARRYNGLLPVDTTTIVGTGASCAWGR